MVDQRADGISRDELQLAARNHGMPLEALRYDVTPAGLHYLLSHFDIPFVDPESWRLSIGGMVERPLTLSLEDIRARPSVSAPVTMECAGNGRALLEPRVVSQPWLTEAVGTAAWTGTPVAALLGEVGPSPGAVDVVFAGLDEGIEGGIEQRYERALPLEQAMDDAVLLAYEMNGATLLPQHGFPLRLVVPGWYGMTHVKWLSSITVIDRAFGGYQHTRAYRLMSAEGDQGEALTRIRPRALMVPPGIPEYMTRDRYVHPGPVVLTGRAWSGFGRVQRVEVSTDGCGTWEDADLHAPVSDHAWVGWSFRWEARLGEHELCCRATDSSGRTQPVDPDEAWNVKGYANNAVQRLRVVVREGEVDGDAGAAT